MSKFSPFEEVSHKNKTIKKLEYLKDLNSAKEFISKYYNIIGLEKNKNDILDDDIIDWVGELLLLLLFRTLKKEENKVLDTYNILMKKYNKLFNNNIDKIIHYRNTAGVTPLYIASLVGHLNIVKDLLEKGAEVNQATNDDAITPFNYSL